MTEVEAITAWAPLLRNTRDIALVPNSMALGYEADLLRLNENRVLTEFEVKLSRADFLADAQKSKHYWYARVRDPKSGFEPVLGSGYTRVPHYFNYLAPPDVVDLDRVPEYAGVIVVTGNQTQVLRRPRRLLKAAVPERTVDHILRSQCRRYWDERSTDAVQAASDRHAVEIVLPRLRFENRDLMDRLRNAQAFAALLTEETQAAKNSATL